VRKARGRAITLLPLDGRRTQSRAAISAIQDYALLLLGFAFAGRASDLVLLDVADLEFTDRGLLVHLRRSKTDQENAGEVIAVPTGQHQETDPVLAVRRWLTISGLTAGPLWRGVDRWNNLSSERLSTRGVTRAIRRAVARTEMDPEHLSSHSLRAGFATSAAAAGASERSIAAQTRHRSMATLRRYIRLATAFDDNAVDRVGCRSQRSSRPWSGGTLASCDRFGIRSM
jgi:integrase